MVVNHKCRSVRRYLQNKVHSKYCTLPPPVGNLLCFNFRSFLFRDSRLEMRHAKCQWFSSNTFSIFYSFHFILLLLDQEDWLVIGDDELDKLKNSEIALGRIEGSVRVAVSLTFFRFRFDYEKESDHHHRSIHVVVPDDARSLAPPPTSRWHTFAVKSPWLDSPSHLYSSSNGSHQSVTYALGATLDNIL